MSARVEATCCVCGAGFSFDPAAFEGLRPPRLCRSCHFERRARLVETEGLVVDVGSVGALLRDGRGELFFWTWSSLQAEAPLPGTRYRLCYDPLERPGPGFHVVARGVQQLP